MDLVLDWTSPLRNESINGTDLLSPSSTSSLFGPDMDNIIWERTHHSPFSDLYNLHDELADVIYNETSSADGVSTFLAIHNTHDYVRFIIETVAIAVVSFPGIVGNILSTIVLLSARMRSPLTYLLLGLAVTDILMILNGLLGMAVPNYCLFFKIDLFQYRFITLLPFIIAMGRTAHVASVLFALCITVERYLAIKDPLKSRTICTLQRAKLTSVCVIVFSVVYNIPKWFEYTYVKISLYEDESIFYIMNVRTTTDTREGVYYLPITGDLRRSSIYTTVNAIVHFTLFYAIPMTLIIYLNTYIYIKIKAAKKQREKMTISQMSDETNLTTMLLIIVLTFIACNVLPVVNLGAKIIHGNPDLFIVNSLRNFLWIFNSSINFLIYYAYSERFRETCLEIWPICFRKTFVKKKVTRTLTSSTASLPYSNSKASSRMSLITISSVEGSMKQSSTKMSM